LASRITSKVVAAFMFVSVAACGSKTENKVKPLAGAGAAGNTAAVATDPNKPADPAAGANAATPTAATAEDAMKYIAENSNLLVVIDVKKLVSSPVMANPAVKAELEKMKAEDETFKKLTAAGIDPFTNVDKIVVSGDASKEMAVIVVSGSFDAAKAAEAAKAEMAKDGKGAVEVVGNALIISEKAEYIAAAKSGKGVDGSPLLKDAMAMVDATRPFFAIGNIPAEAAGDLKDIPVPGLATAKNAAFSMAFDKGFDMNVTLQLGSEADATQAKTGLDSMLPMLAGLGLPPDLMSAMKTEAKGANINLNINLNEDQLKKLEEMAKEMNPGMPMPGGDMPAPGAEPMKAPEAPEAPAPAEK
jgi:hypothetical protein